MRIGGFELPEPVPELRRPHVIASLTPWIDAGHVGSSTLGRLERHFAAGELGTLATPGKFFDFTRYRPTVYYEDGQRRFMIPNADLHYGLGPGEHDFILLHMLEPHVFAEEYIDSIVKVLEHFKVERFCRVGGVYDAVPHTRPLPVIGTLNDGPLTGVAGVETWRRRGYQGPTSILNMVGEKARALGIENMSLMVRLPHYLQLERDYAGRTRLLESLCALYGFPSELGVSRRGERQYAIVNGEMENNSDLKGLVRQLEADYDARRGSRPRAAEDDEPSEEALPPLPPSVQEFLTELGDQASNS